MDKISAKNLTLVFLRGWLPPPNGLSPIAPKRKQSDPGHLSNLFYILCGHFDEKNPGSPPNTGGRVSRQSPRVRGWLPPETILSRHFEKYLHDMDLKLTEHVRNTISLLYKQNTEIPIFGTFSERINFGLYFA